MSVFMRVPASARELVDEETVSGNVGRGTARAGMTGRSGAAIFRAENLSKAAS